MKKILAFVLALTMVLSLTACGGDGDTSGGVKVTIFNTKSEINAKMEEMAKEYSATHDGVTVEVYMSNDTVSAHMATKYTSGEPYTIAMVDAKDIYTFGPEHAIDLSDQPYVANTTQAISVDGKVAGVPFCVEGRGILYNSTAIEAITGKTFNPADYATLDAFKGLLDELVAGGMEAPVGIMKEDWSLAGHFLSQVYEERDNVQGIVDSLYAGTADLANDAKFNSLMDTFDVLRQYNYAASSPIAAEREVSEQKLAEGEIAFMFGGNWDWANMSAYDYSDQNFGMMPVPQNVTDGSNTKLVGGGSKYLFIEASDAVSDEERAAAKDFLVWLFTTDEGAKWITEDFMLVPAYSNIVSTSLDPMGASFNEYFQAGNTIDNFNGLPDDHYSKVGAEMQRYLAGQSDRASLAAAIESYWSSLG